MADFNSGRVWAAWVTPGLRITPESFAKISSICDEWRPKGLCATDALHGGWPGGFEHADLKTDFDSSVGMRRLVDDKTRLVFEQFQFEANEKSQKDNPSDEPQVDPYLHMGGLKNRSCGVILAMASGEIIFPPRGETDHVKLWQKYKIEYIAIHYAGSRSYLYWSPEKVQEIAKKINWKKAEIFIKEKKVSMAILHSAKAFFDACVKLNLGVRFAAQ